MRVLVTTPERNSSGRLLDDNVEQRTTIPQSKAALAPQGEAEQPRFALPPVIPSPPYFGGVRNLLSPSPLSSGHLSLPATAGWASEASVSRLFIARRAALKHGLHIPWRTPPCSREIGTRGNI